MPQSYLHTPMNLYQLCMPGVYIPGIYMLEVCRLALDTPPVTVLRWFFFGKLFFPIPSPNPFFQRGTWYIYVYEVSLFCLYSVFHMAFLTCPKPFHDAAAIHKNRSCGCAQTQCLCWRARRRPLVLPGARRPVVEARGWCRLRLRYVRGTAFSVCNRGKNWSIIV